MNTTGVQDPKPAREGHRQRRRYLIKPAFQVKYAVTISAVVFFASLMMASILYGILHHQARMRLLDPAGYVAEVPLVICFSALSFAALTTAGVGVWCIIITHRICGPLYVLENFFRDLADGRSPALRPLRRKDEFKDLHELFGRAVRSLEERRRSEMKMLADALQIARTAPAAEEEACRKTLDSIAATVDALRAEITDAVGDDVKQSDAHLPR